MHSKNIPIELYIIVIYNIYILIVIIHRLYRLICSVLDDFRRSVFGLLSKTRVTILLMVSMFHKSVSFLIEFLILETINRDKWR